MISKPVPANSFYHTCRYISNKPGAELLVAEGVRGHDYKLMAEDFQTQQQLKPDKKKACFHSILSFYPGERPSDETMKEIAMKYLKELGIVNTQYAISKHTDKAHLHVHIVANMVNNEGKAISDSWIGLKGKKIAQRLTQEYKLVPALGKNLRLTNMEALSNLEANKYKIYIAISENLPHCQTMEELEKCLLKQGIQTLYKYKSHTQEKQGVSFKVDNISFKGSQVDRKFSLSGLEKILALQQRQVQKQGKEFYQDIGNRLEKTMDMLLNVEQTQGQIPYELTEKALHQKKKKRSQQLSR
ncbi:Relaxase/Mobilisation nuclease domain-containing protein [Hydrobacter penzbergensis]|uniref:Relaxase/Mobilisation nuclease domain-containing protein n=1 Tax=Hydrobacter penzbergensis TaxID=1235997 RepID=A0A8X8IJE0_9BACT|nr:relaxase/mobilization nuclease domain-containing protein [Hydrobacter penzbergensis]SDX68507.1 Relaxase/Mobilisation nuclease domain-containing protein [Hydrobacter penzbergensis]